jgi:hypothetical protein
MKTLSLKLSVLFTLLYICAQAQNWTGNINSDWNNSSNWSSWPLNGEDIMIDTANYTGAGASPVITTASVFSPDGVTIQNGAFVTIQNNLTANGRIEIIGEGTVVMIAGGSVHAAGSGSRGRFIVAEGAQTTMNGGNLLCEERLISELGGTFILNGGTINTEELALVDGNPDENSSFIQNGGTIVLGAELAFENESGAFEPFFLMNNGSLTVNGNVSWLGEAPGAGTPRMILKGGNISIDGNILNSPGSTVNLYLEINDSAAVEFSGASISLLFPNDTLLQKGLSELMITGPSSIINNGVFHAENTSTDFEGTVNLTGTGVYSFNTIDIRPAGTLQHTSPATISIKGNINNDGVFAGNLNTVVMNGFSPQFIGGSNVTAFHHLAINNSSDVSLNRETSVSGTLQLINGRINTSAVNMLVMQDNSLTSGASDSSFVNGPLKKIGNDAFIFHVGKISGQGNIGISAPSDLNDAFIAEYFNTAYSDTTSLNAPLGSVSSREYWNLEQSMGSDSIVVNLFWNDAAASGIVSCTDLTIAQWNGTAWNNVPAQASGDCVSGSGNVQSLQLLQDKGIVTFGSVTFTTSVEQIKKAEEFNIFPNPAIRGSDLTVILSDSNDAEILVIYDHAGRIIREIRIKERVVKVFQDLAPGIYFISVSSKKNERPVKKLIVN